MARPLRIEFPGALYHVMSRGNEKRPIVRDDADRHKRIDWLRRCVETYGWRLHAFVLLNNHDHLFVETPEANLSAGMQFYNSGYTGYFNWRHGRVGHLFQGRFKSHLIEEEGYFLEVSRYIHLNPVRARLVQRPEEYAFSSYRGYHWSRRRPDWMTYHRVLGEFGRDTNAARRNYRRFVRAGVDEAIPSPFKRAFAGVLLGGDRFIDRIRSMLDNTPDDLSQPELSQLRPKPAVAAVIAAVARHFEVDPETWAAGRRTDNASRAVAAYLLRCKFGYQARTVAAALGYASSSGVGQAVHRIEAAGADVERTVRTIQRKFTNG